MIAHRGQDRVENELWMEHDQFVVEPQHGISEFRQQNVPTVVTVLRIFVEFPSVRLDDYAPGNNEIN